MKISYQNLIIKLSDKHSWLFNKLHFEWFIEEGAYLPF